MDEFRETLLALHTLAYELNIGFIYDRPYFKVTNIDASMRWTIVNREGKNFDRLIDEVLEAMVDCSTT